MYRCPDCYSDFLMRVEPCPGCIDQANRKARAKKAKERRHSYDPNGQIEDWEFWDLLRWYRTCPCCGKNWSAVEMIARDHIVPVSRGGPNEAKNLQPLCQPCNLWKSDRIIYFDRHFAGRCAPLPEYLLPYLRAAAPGVHEQTTFLEAAPLDLRLRYPEATARQLEEITLHLSTAQELDY
ncbi:HNH endonuclease [Gloeobacter kilaueensis]|uniref:HNH endonuclease n=1 Tax=Gloeobacter kilaueensis (strain ATCC BAA-2537 / CCAP 1431/1 / ULC 316 / JS1) TaxID=1183438 RepID=U5QKP9_GLOK1|nr:HNH endonuclease signature motif containing protein [Gloeobacter kilaueensis]AGY59557.1 HNH endonuclease [Gloeobacter kilaueensis JS1]